MNPNNALSPGFTPLDKVVEIIKSDTRSNPVIDMDYVVSRLRWIEVAHNFRIPRIKRLPQDQIYRTKRGKSVEYETIGEINVYIADAFERELLKKTILDKYRELVGHEYFALGVKAKSTVADDAQGRDAVRPRVNTPIAKEGSSIGGGETTTTNGQGLSV